MKTWKDELSKILEDFNNDDNNLYEVRLDQAILAITALVEKVVGEDSDGIEIEDGCPYCGKEFIVDGASCYNQRAREIRKRLGER